jgi:uncharacterized membrane protein YdcZ (DUF606 family)
VVNPVVGVNTIVVVAIVASVVAAVAADFIAVSGTTSRGFSERRTRRVVEP